MHVFPMIDWHHHSHCIQHCEKLGGRSPPVRTLQEWQTLYTELGFVQADGDGVIRDLWLSVTEGDKNNNLVRLDHWPTTTKATEGVWRDYYTGDQLHNYTKPWYTENADNKDGNNSNCIYYHQLSGCRGSSCLLNRTRI